MSPRSRFSLVLSTFATGVAIVLSGCGSSGDSGGDASVADPATAFAAGTPIYIDATIRPQGDQKKAIEDLVQKVAGIDPGQKIIEAIDKSSKDDGEDITFADDIEPWLGEQAAVAVPSIDYAGGDTPYEVVIQSTDSAAATDFLAKAKQKDDTNGTYKGFDYLISDKDGTVSGVVDDFLVVADSEDAFSQVVDTLNGGDSLETDKSFTETMSRASDSSVANAYVDIGGLIQAAGPSVDQQILGFYKALGVDFSNSTALASLVPSSDKVELDISTNAGAGLASTGDASELIASFPGDSFAAFAAADVGKQIKRALDGIDSVGFPPQVPPGALKSTLAKAGVNLNKIAATIGDVGLFVNGTGLTDIGGALVVTTDSSMSAADAVTQLTSFLQRSGAPGFSLLKGKSGFMVQSSQLPRPLVVLAQGDRVAAGLGLPQTLQAASGGSGETLADNPTFGAASDALGDVNISGFVDIQPIISLAALAAPYRNETLKAALPYLEKFSYLAFGNGTDGEFATSKVILALED